MRKALFISSSFDESKSQEEGNRWHCLSESDEHKIDYWVKNDIPEQKFQTYLSAIACDALIYLANEHSLAYLSSKEFGARRKAGMIFVYSDSEFVSNTKIAECIGCTIPSSLKKELNPPYYGSGRNIEEYLKKDPCELGWFQKSMNKDDTYDIKSVIVPILDQILTLLLNRDKRNKRCLIVSAKNDVSVLGTLLKCVLLSLPSAIANQISFNTNACTFQALKDIDIACVGNVDNFVIPEESKDEFIIIDIDKGISDYQPSTITCKYVIEKNAVPTALKECSAQTATQLESSISEIKLLDICGKRIDHAVIHDALELYKLVGDDTKEKVKNELISAAYRILLSENHFNICESDRRELSNLFLVSSEQEIESVSNRLQKAISAFGDEKGSEFLLFLFGLRDRNLINSVTKDISDFLYGGGGLNDARTPTIKLFLDECFEEYLCNFPANQSPDSKLETAIADHISNKYTSGKSKIELYLRIRTRNRNSCLWLEKLIFNSGSLSSGEDLKLWGECYETFTGEENEQEHNILAEQFKDAFKEFLDTIDFNRTADELFTKIKSSNLELIKTVSTVFGYDEAGFTRKFEEIESIKRKNFIADVMLYRRCQFLINALYPTDIARKKLFRPKKLSKSYNLSEDDIKKKLIKSKDRLGNIKKNNKREEGTSLHFLNGLSLSIILPLFILIAMTLFLYEISANGYGWTLFGSLLNISAEILRSVFFSFIIAAYFLTYLISMNIGHRQDMPEGVVAAKACYIATVVILLPCTGVTLFMMLIG